MTTTACEPDSAEPKLPAVRVRVEVDDDDSARRVEAVLGALGFDVLRDLSRRDGDLFDEVAAVTASRYSLSDRERVVLLALLRGGQSRDELAEHFGVTPSTIKFHLYNLHFKLGVRTREQLLRLVLRLDDQRWLREPRRQRDALERLDQAAHEAIVALRSGHPGANEHALQLLDEALADAHRLAGLEHG